MNELVLGIALLVGSGLLSLILPERYKGYLVLAGSLAGFVAIAFAAAPALVGGGTIEARIQLGFPLWDTRWSLDPLSAFFMLLVAAGGFLASLYSTGYMAAYHGHHSPLAAYWFFLPLLAASMALVLCARNALAFLIAWELMSLSSFFLVAFEGDEPAVLKAALYYLIAMQIGLAFIVAGFALMVSKSGSMDFDDFGALLRASPSLSGAVFVLLFAGFGTKAGLLPFHGWLPEAHPAAPSPVSALMSGVMIKTGFYGILRFSMLSGPPEPWMAYVVLGISGATGLFGVLQAAVQRDLKRLLAWSTVENAGIIGLGLGLGMLGRSLADPVLTTLGFGAALLHCLNHFACKSLLFYGAGSVYHATGTRDLEELGALARTMPVTGAAFAVGAGAISALPPFGCFVSEFLLYLAAAGSLGVHAAGGGAQGGALRASIAVLVVAALALIGAVSLIAFTKAAGLVFLGERRKAADREPHEAPFSMLVPMLVLAAATLAVGLFPEAAFGSIWSVVSALAGKVALTSGAVVPGLGRSLAGISRGVGAFALCVVALLLVRAITLRGRTVRRAPTWNCGYRAAPGASARIQYTAGSFVAPLAILFRGPLLYKKLTSGGRVLFPEKSSVELSSGDPVERGLVGPMLRGVEKFLRLFSWVQSGYTQQYLLYGIVFLVAIILWLAGGR